MPEASSSAPGAMQFGLEEQPGQPMIESWWPPRTTISPGRVAPGMVRMTESYGVIPPWSKNSTVTSARPAARPAH